MTLDRFLSAWSAEDYGRAGSLTDGGPEAAEQLEANRNGLDGATLVTDVRSFAEEGSTAEAMVRMDWEVPEIGEFAYSTDLELIESEAGDWLVSFSEKVIHPNLRDTERLGTERIFEDRAPILDRNGRRIVANRLVVDIGIIRGESDDVGAAIAAVAANTEADAATLRRAVRAAGPETFVTAITLRQADFQAVESRLRPVSGVFFTSRVQALAPSPQFGAALLGGVAPITAEQLEELGEPYDIGDRVGQSGLAAAFERRLAGTPLRRIVIRNAEAVAVKTLLEMEGSAGKPLRTTLDYETQSAAEQALNGERGNVSLVALQPSSGDVLAVANRPGDDTFDRALEGQYPPGSTFKVISTAALLDGGLSTSEIVDCPPLTNAGGQLFRNFEGGAAGAVPFSQDFAESCNTAFVSLAPRLEPTVIPGTAKRFGLGRSYELALPVFSGSVPRPSDAAEQAAAMIGQGRNLASPLAMAGVAATVADGRWRQPRLIESDPRQAGPPLPGDTVGDLRRLMRLVVTSGTGTAVAGVPGRVAGKSGTAEYGSGNPPPTHGWFIAFRGNLAVAVIVEGAPSGGQFAAPIVAEMLESLPPGG